MTATKTSEAQGSESTEMRVEVAFRVAPQGGELSTDHGYALFAALCRRDPTFHAAPWLAVHPLVGRALGNTLVLDVRGQPLRFRVPPDRIPAVLSLVGATLEVAGASLLVGASSLYVLRHEAALASRLVTMKGYVEPEPFKARVEKELEARGIVGTVAVERRRIVTVNGDKVVGFGVRVTGLNEGGSLALQYGGLGGRQRFGCGIFGPATRAGRGA